MPVETAHLHLCFLRVIPSGVPGSWWSLLTLCGNDPAFFFFFPLPIVIDIIELYIHQEKWKLVLQSMIVSFLFNCKSFLVITSCWDRRNSICGSVGIKKGRKLFFAVLKFSLGIEIRVWTLFYHLIYTSSFLSQEWLWPALEQIGQMLIYFDKAFLSLINH